MQHELGGGGTDSRKVIRAGDDVGTGRKGRRGKEKKVWGFPSPHRQSQQSTGWDASVRGETKGFHKIT